MCSHCSTSSNPPWSLSVVGLSSNSCKLRGHCHNGCAWKQCLLGKWHQHRVDAPKSNIAIIWTPLFDLYVFGLDQRVDINMCLKEIGLRAQKVLTSLGSIVNMTKGTYMTTKWAWESSLWSWIRHSYALWDLCGKWLRAWFGLAN